MRRPPSGRSGFASRPSDTTGRSADDGEILPAPFDGPFEADSGEPAQLIVEPIRHVDTNDPRRTVDETGQIQILAEPDQSDEARRTRVWRFDQFVALGFDFARAALMADDSRIDLA